MNLGKLLREKRLLREWTQGYAAKEIGIQQSYLSKLENNQFIPSDEVIEKLKQVYDLSDEELGKRELNVHNVPTLIFTKYLVVSFVLGALIIFIGFNSLLFDQTYYTYQTTELNSLTEEQFILSYELTDVYKGEMYQQKFAGKMYSYQLLGVREVPRKENNWIVLFGSLLCFASIISAVGYRKVLNHKKSK